jgi:carbon-monoxide dehydrogenase medium subunit
MYPAKFDYIRADSIQEAIGLLQQHEDAKLLAGGHSLLPAMKLRLAQPAVLVDIGRIADLKEISQNGSTIKIGALSTHASLAASDVLQANCAVLSEAAVQVGDQQVRNKGTIGGNLAHADPASDLPAAVLALGGTVTVVGPNGERTIAASDFFVDLLTTDLQIDEILTSIEVNTVGANSGSAYLKFEHPASGFAICGAAAIVSLNAAGNCASASLYYNGVTATPLDGSAVANALVGSDLSDAAIDAAVNDNLTVPDPMSDIHASGEYRTQLAKVYGRRALKLARDRAKG